MVQFTTEHINVFTLPIFITTHVNVGGAAMSEQVEQVDKNIVITVVTCGTYLVLQHL